MTLDKAYKKLRATRARVAGQSEVGAVFTGAVADGKALADDGEQYNSVQDAVDAASSWVYISPGTYSESVTISTAGLTLSGSGNGSLIDSGTEIATITVSASDVTIKNIAVKNTGDNFSERPIEISSGATNALVNNVTIEDSASNGIRSNALDTVVTNCVQKGGQRGFRQDADGMVIVGCIIKDVSFAGINNGAQDYIYANNVILNAGTDGIRLDRQDGIVIGNRIHNSTEDGIELAAAADNNIIANNRISGSGTSDIDNAGSGVVLDSNLTGAAN